MIYDMTSYMIYDMLRAARAALHRVATFPAEIVPADIFQGLSFCVSLIC